MSTRRLLEVWENNRSIEFRTRLNATDSTDPDVLMVIRVMANMDWCLDGRDVEDLHQFTYDLLAGPTRDPRLPVVDAQIMCGERIQTLAGPLECALFADHARLGNFDHVTSTGLLFDTPGF